MTIDLDDLEAKAKAATPGLWEHYEKDGVHWDDPMACGYDRKPNHTTAFDYYCTGPRAPDGNQASADAAFIAAANPAVVLELIAELRTLRAAAAGTTVMRCQACRAMIDVDRDGLVVEHRHRGERCFGSGHNPVRI